MTRRELWNRIRGAALKVYGEAEASSVAALITEELYGLAKTGIFLDPADEVDAKTAGNIDDIVRQLEDARPVQYITGRAGFCGRRFSVREGVLIPRPETEELVGWIIGDFKDRGSLSILDIGTGSGCIAVSLAAVLPGARVTAIDISEKALEIARENASANGVEVRFLQADILADALPAGEQFDIIVSNPPYVRESEKAQMGRNVLGYEPHQALFVDDADPLVFYREIADKGKTALAAGGALYFEINEALGRETLAMLSGAGYAGAELRRDLHGKPRIVKAWLE